VEQRSRTAGTDAGASDGGRKTAKRIRQIKSRRAHGRNLPLAFLFQAICWQLILIAVTVALILRGAAPSIDVCGLTRRRQLSASCENSSFFPAVSSCSWKQPLRYIPDLVNRNFPESAFGTGV
jgi:hypothetical protein